MKETRMTTTSNYGFNQIDCTQDTKMLFKDYVEKDSKENWQKADTVIKNVENKVDKVKSDIGNLVTLDGESKQNFNFIESKITQGWIDNSTYDFNLNNDDFSILFDLKPSNLKETTTLLYMTNGFQIFYSTSTGNIRFGVLGDTVAYTEMGKYMPNKHYIFNVVKMKNTVNVMINNDNYIIDVSKMKGGTTKILTPAAMSGLYNIYKVYNKALESIEQQHNLSVLNNSPSIKELHTTDSEGKTSILKFASDTDHVEDRSGRTQEQINRTFYKRMCKEIPSPSGKPITVENGEEGYVLSAEIKGQTIKNYGVLTNKYYSFNTWALSTDYVRGLQLGKTYYMVVDIKTPTTNGYVHLRGVKNNYLTDATLINNMSGINILTQPIHSSATQQDLDDYINCRIMYYSNGIQCEAKVLAIVETLEEAQKIKSFLGFGLSSTEAIISNNGKKYPIYEPTIQGKTRILNGQLVSLEPSDPTLLNLDSVQDVYDEVNLSMKQLTKKIGDMTLNGSESWIWSAVDSSKNIGYVSLPLEQIAPNQNESILTLNNLFTDINGGEGHGRRKEGLCLTDGKYLRIMYKSGDVRFSNLSTFKQYLADNNLRVKYVLNQPMTQQLTEELVPTILTHNKTNIWEVGGAVKPSSFKVTVPTTDGIKKEYTLTPINGWTGTAKANLLQTGDTELVLDLTIPESFNTLITNLPNELRPKVERTVLGYNGNTPVVVKIGTDGTVKLPVTATGTVKLDDTYKL